MKECRVYYDSRENIEDIKRLVREREPVNMASSYPNHRQYDQDLLEDYFGYRIGYYGECPNSKIPDLLCPPNILVYTPTPTTLSQNYGNSIPGELPIIHVLNAYGLAFDGKYQRDYRAFSELLEGECVEKAKQFYRHLFTNIFKVAINLKMETIVMSLVGGGFFSERWLKWLPPEDRARRGKAHLLQYIWNPTFNEVRGDFPDINVLFMGTRSMHREYSHRYFGVEDIGFFPGEVISYLQGTNSFWGTNRPNILSKTLLINSWDCWSSPGNGNRGDNSLDGHIGRNTCVGYLGTGVTNPYLEENLLDLS